MEWIFDNYTLRFISADDLPAYYRLIDDNRKRLEDFFAGTVAETRSLEDTRNFLTARIADIEKKKAYPFVIADNTNDKLVASLQVKSIDWSIPKAELGYYIDAAYEGKGLITKALQLIIAWCFHDLKLNKLYIRSYAKNVSSIKVAEKNGFKLEGVITCDYKTTAGELVDLMYYGLLNPSLEARQ